MNQKIIVFPNIDRDPGFEVAQRICELLRLKGKVVKLCPMVYEDNPIDFSKLNIITDVFENELHDTEMIITIGGDGTLLRAARAVTDLDISVLGVNMGGKGFLAEIELSDISLIESVAEGMHKIENRMMLDAVVVRDGNPVYCDFALNDVVIKGDNKVIDLALFGDGQQIMQFSGDGAVIATPTGSTAYSMAAGGPIVEPTTDNIIVTPVCAHALAAKSIVLASDRCVTVEVGQAKHNPAYMSVDGGKHITILCDDIIKINVSKRVTRLIKITNKSFYQRVNDKLGTSPSAL